MKRSRLARRSSFSCMPWLINRYAPQARTKAALATSGSTIQFPHQRTDSGRLPLFPDIRQRGAKGKEQLPNFPVRSAIRFEPAFGAQQTTIMVVNAPCSILHLRRQPVAGAAFLADWYFPSWSRHRLQRGSTRPSSACIRPTDGRRRPFSTPASRPSFRRLRPLLPTGVLRQRLRGRRNRLSRLHCPRRCRFEPTCSRSTEAHPNGIGYGQRLHVRGGLPATKPAAFASGLRPGGDRRLNYCRERMAIAAANKATDGNLLHKSQSCDREETT